jgi:hypothetical protein
MKTLNRFASVMEALPNMDPVDPSSDGTLSTGHHAVAGSGSPSAFPQA